MRHRLPPRWTPCATRRPPSATWPRSTGLGCPLLTWTGRCGCTGSSMAPPRRCGPGWRRRPPPASWTLPAQPTSRTCCVTGSGCLPAKRAARRRWPMGCPASTPPVKHSRPARSAPTPHGRWPTRSPTDGWGQPHRPSRCCSTRPRGWIRTGWAGGSADARPRRHPRSSRPKRPGPSGTATSGSGGVPTGAWTGT